VRSSLLCCCFAILAVSAGEVPIVEVDVVDGQRHGDLKVRDADGMIRVRGEYARGEPVGRVSAYGEDGLLEWRAEYPRTRAEVLAGVERLWIAEPIPLSYEREAVTGPDEFAVAEIPDAQYDQALRLTNFYRFVAGVPHDVEIDEDYNDACAHGATVLASLGGISHRPPRPEGMDRDFYRRGYDACSKSNLQGAFLRYLAVMVHFFMWDGDATNARKVGHRRWVINPTMKKVGFGAAGQIGLMYAVDKSRLHRWDWVSWPGRGWQPLRLFPAKLPWSIHLNRDRYRVPGENEIEVVVERLDANYRPVEEVGFDFVAVEEGFGTTNIAIVFRPRIDRELLRAARARDPDLDWHGLDAGELRYAVHLSGLRPRRRGIEIDQVDYLVHFFPWEAPGDGERRPGEEGVVAVGEEDRPGEKAGGDGEAEAEAGDDDAPVELGLGERESLLWQALNRFRADPGADARRLRPPTSRLLPGLGHEVDWELFLGSAPKRDFDLERFFRWRCYKDYSGGIATDLFIHRITRIMRACDLLYPRRVVGMGGIWQWPDGRDLPDNFEMICEYPRGMTVYVLGTMSNRVPIDHLVRGYRATLYFTSSGWVAKDKDGKVLEEHRKTGAESIVLHHTNLHNHLRDGEELNCPVMLGMAGVVAVNMANESWRSGRMMAWDDKAQKMVPADSLPEQNYFPAEDPSRLSDSL